MRRRAQPQPAGVRRLLRALPRAPGLRALDQVDSVHRVPKDALACAVLEALIGRAHGLAAAGVLVEGDEVKQPERDGGRGVGLEPLEEGGGRNRSERLKWHSHEVIRRKVVQILEWLSGPDDVQNMHEENVYEQNGYEEDGFEENGYKQNLDKQNEHTGGRRGRKNGCGNRQHPPWARAEKLKSLVFYH